MHSYYRYNLSNASFYFTLIVLLILFANRAQAENADGSARIKISGLVLEGTPKRITIKDIEKIGVAEVSVYNPYEKEKQRYSGVWMNEFVEAFAASGVTSMTLTAIDDYEITFSSDEWNTMRILLVTRTNGSYMGFEQKGPIRAVFPDYDPKLKVYQLKTPKWLWMVTRVKFK